MIFQAIYLRKKIMDNKPNTNLPCLFAIANSSMVTSNLHETTLSSFENISFKVYLKKLKGKLDILLFSVILIQPKLDI